jgi:class 3 adenylate cyclase
VVWVFALQEPHRQAEERIIKKSPEDKERDITETAERDLDLGKILEERQRLESLLKEKFTRVITVMFTDCKGSTTITELEGDMAWRLILKHHNDILFQAVKEHNGILVKTMGDGTMSYFSHALDAIRCAVYIQKGIAKLNKNRKTAVPVQIRIGVHTGSGIVEKHDIFGDVVNVAARFEGLANPDEIYFSEDTFNALSDKEEINCRFIKKSRVKGKSQPYKVYRAFWKEGEFEKAAFEGYSLKLRESGGAKRTIPISKNEITITTRRHQNYVYGTGNG